MSDSTNPDKLQVPLQDKDGYFYPLTTFDQIIMQDGVTRWDGKSGEGTLTLSENGKIMSEGVEVSIDAATVNGMTLDQLKKAIMAEAVYQ